MSEPVFTGDVSVSDARDSPIVDPVLPNAGYKKCPICGSWETTRHAEHFRVWFTCNRCGAVFS